MSFKTFRLRKNVCSNGLLTAYAVKEGSLPRLSPCYLIFCGGLLTLLAVLSGCNDGSKKTFKIPPPSTGGLLSKEVQESKAERGSRYVSADYLENDYTLGPGDVLDITVFGGEEFDRKVRVSGTGNITFPYLGSVLAEGRTVPELAFTLELMLGEKYLKNPQVSVFMEEFRSKKVTVVGEVGSPQVLRLQKNSSTLMEALGNAGGVLKEAGNTIYVIRTAPIQAVASTSSSESESLELAISHHTHNLTADEEAIVVQMQDTVIPIDMRDLFEYRNPMANIEVFAGDIVSVPRGQFVFIMGQVDKPGGHPLTEGMTALQAVSMGGKFAPTYTPRNVRLIRRDHDGSTTFATLDLVKIKNGEEDDVEILPGDVLIVGRSIAKTVALQTLEIARVAAGYLAGRVLYDKISGDND